MYAIKVKETGKKAWAFLTPKGGINRLRVHASQFDSRDRADQVRDQVAADNPGHEFKVVSL